MATTVTELNIATKIDPKLPDYWCLNVSSDNASTVREIKAAETGKRHWIEHIVITCVTANADTDWVKLMDGNDNLIGQMVLAKGVPFDVYFSKPLRGTTNTALNIKTATDFGVHMIVEGFSDP